MKISIYEPPSDLILLDFWYVIFEYIKPFKKLNQFCIEVCDESNRGFTELEQL